MRLSSLQNMKPTLHFPKPTQLHHLIPKPTPKPTLREFIEVHDRGSFGQIYVQKFKYGLIVDLTTERVFENI